MEVFELDGHEYVELCNLLKLTGLCHSGGLAKVVIGDGLVTVDGEVELRKRCKIRANQEVEFQGVGVKVVE